MASNKKGKASTKQNNATKTAGVTEQLIANRNRRDHKELFSPADQLYRLLGRESSGKIQWIIETFK